MSNQSLIPSPIVRQQTTVVRYRGFVKVSKQWPLFRIRAPIQAVDAL